MSETLAETAKRLEGRPNTSANGQKCELAGAGKHVCGAAVTLEWGHWLCGAGLFSFGDWDHRGRQTRLERWMESMRSAKP